VDANVKIFDWNFIEKLHMNFTPAILVQKPFKIGTQSRAV